MLTDPISDFLNQLKNAAQAKHRNVQVRFSKFKEALAQVLKKEGFVKDVSTVTEEKLSWLVVELLPEKILHVKRISKPGRRIYTSFEKIPKVKSGLGIVLLSTSQGVMSNKEAYQKKIGGEYLGEVY